MNRMPVLVLAVGAALAAPAFADTYTVSPSPNAERVTTYTWDAAAGRYVEQGSRIYYTDPAPVVTYPDPNPAVTYTAPEYVAPGYPVTEYPAPEYASDSITVTAPRGEQDRMITNDVVDRIATDPGVSGQVGVDTYRNNVTLTGRVSTPAQVDRAERDAKSVPGVNDVTNTIRPRVGG